MSLFKRKGRRISSFADEDAAETAPSDDASTEPPVLVPVRFGKRPGKHSSLRRSLHIRDDADLTPDGDDTQEGDDGDDSGPAVVRPSVSRASSTRSKKRMSFGVSSSTEDAGTAAEDRPTGVTTPRRTGISALGQRVLETNAFRKSLSGRLPTRPLGAHDDSEDRPRYSKEDLAALQSATPNTPHKSEEAAAASAADDSMQLDASELEGALVVDASDLGTGGALAMPAPPAAAAHLLSQTEIQERKDRRARRALEQGALALGSDDDDANGYISLSVGGSQTGKTAKKESRLVREDEDLGEGYDEFVEDGGLSLGRKAERAARRRRQQEMASLIQAAEGDGAEDGSIGAGAGAGVGDPDDDSEAERMAAYNAAQTRAGMDGLQRAAESHAIDGQRGALPKMQPLPDLAECLGRMQRTVQALEAEAAQRRQQLAAVAAEKADIMAREAEVQAILDRAGQTYGAALGQRGSAAAAATSPFVTQSPLPAERGLESLGGTPVRRENGF